MALTRDVPDCLQESILQQACLRNQSLEIHFVNQRNQDCIARSRFLAIEPDRLLIERPTMGMHIADVPMETVISVYFCTQKERYGFRAFTRGTVLFQLNDRQRLVALELGRPDAVERRQRRACFRVSLASHRDLYAWFEPAALPGEAPAPPDSPGLPDAEGPAVPESRDQPAPDCADGSAPAESRPFKMRIANLSAGGLAAVMDLTHRSARALKVGDVYCVSFDLPEDGGHFRFETEIRHVRTHADSATRVVGCRFLRGQNLFDMRKSVQRLARFVADEQRRQLQRGGRLP